MPSSQLEEFVLTSPETAIEPEISRPPHHRLTKLSDRAQRRLAVALLLVFLPCLIFYYRLARKIDERLADGPFSASLDILSGPRTIYAGEPMGRDEFVQILLQSGYTQSPGNSTGWFQAQHSAVKILPGVQSVVGGGPVRVEFASGRISSIVSLDDNRAMDDYRLNPQLMANLSPANEKRRLVRFADIPKPLVNAVLSVEDKRFFQHGGFDLVRAAKAAYIDIRDGRKSEGASTLTMQLARGIWLDRAKNWGRKAEEILITSYLEDKLSKQQIFEDYANEVYLGQRGAFSINGFGEAAWVLFGKDLSQIDTAEAALLAGLIRRPTSYNPLQYPDKARGRRDVVLGLMRHNGYLTDDQYRQAVDEPVHIAAELAREPANSWFIALLNRELRSRFGEESAPNRRVYTSLDPELQNEAEEAVRIGMVYVDQQLRSRGTQPPSGQPQVALVALDPATGEVKALVGGRDYRSSQINHALAMRQPGSVFKPFVYAAAVSTAVEGGRRIFTPATILEDEATTFYDSAGAYQPRDFHGGFMGEVTLRTALAHSLNVATVSLAQQVGYKNVVAMARRAGLNDRIRPTPAVALGAYEATPLEIAGAYTMFANHGQMVHPTTISTVRSQSGSLVYRHDPNPYPALDPRAAYLMVSMMQEVLRSGTGAGVQSRGFTLPAAGKTGTSRDGWFAGFTEKLLCVVWVGFDDNSDLNLEGARSALPIWAEFMRRAAHLREYGSVHDFQRPPGVTSVEICSDSGELAGPDCPNVRWEVFVTGTQPNEECDLHHDIGAGNR